MTLYHVNLYVRQYPRAQALSFLSPFSESLAGYEASMRTKQPNLYRGRTNFILPCFVMKSTTDGNTSSSLDLRHSLSHLQDISHRMLISVSYTCRNVCWDAWLKSSVRVYIVLP